MDGDGRPFEQLLRERFPKEPDESDKEWRERAYASAEQDRGLPYREGETNLVRSANDVGQRQESIPDPLASLKERWPMLGVGETEESYLERIYAPGGPAGVEPAKPDRKPRPKTKA